MISGKTSQALRVLHTYTIPVTGFKHKKMSYLELGLFT